MSPQPGPKSNEVSGPLAASFVYDFIYHDERRIASFLSQLGSYGQLQSLKHSLSSGSAASSKGVISARGGIPGVASASANAEEQAADQLSEALEQSYDPLWTNALDFFEKLHERSLIIKDLTKARIGQFVQCNGTLAISDLKLMMKAYELPIFRATAGVVDLPPPSQHGRKSERAPPTKTAATHPIDFGLELLTILPHGVQARIVGSEGAVWSALKEESLTTSSSDLLLKNGTSIPGEWTMLGIMDAFAGDETPGVDNMDAEIAKHGAVSAMVSVLAPVVRQMLGRPSGYFGVTPLMIFREVAA